VGIGKPDPSAPLDVAGKIICNEVEVTSVGKWKDYVFDNGYELPRLQKVEEFIAENGHLPEIPSEKEVLENGYDLSEMDAKLLQKIEELTLYVIDLKKEINQLKAE
jgi:Asp-tRNA(Asn)/Glu-tRNA(Gln) amidotransferase B subunit